MVTQKVPNVAQGWVSKPKGAFQILFEQGWIDPSVDPRKYTWFGRNDEYGNRISNSSIRDMIRSQTDFLNQETLLQFYCKHIGVKTDRSPVAHPEIAGEGIEFDWGCSKLSYQAQPLSAKQNKTKFHELVNTVLGETILSLSLVRSNAR